MLTKEKQQNFYKELGKAIRDARKLAGLKQEYVASQIGLTRTSLVNIEYGSQKIQLHSLVELAEILNISLLDLIPDIHKTVTPDLNKSSEAKLTKEIENKVNDSEGTLEILKDFIRISKIKVDLLKKGTGNSDQNKSDIG